MKKSQETKVNKKDKAPSSLSELSEGLQKLLKDTEEIEKILDGTSIEVNESKMKKEEKSGEDSGEGKDGESKPKDDSDKGEQIKDEKLLETWINIDKEIENIHNKWNLYEVEGVKKGIDIDKRDGLGESLNALTKSIEDRTIGDIYDYASQSMLKLSPIFNMYKDEIKGNINKIRYFVYQGYLKGVEGRNKEAQDLLKGLEDDISQIRTKLQEDEEKIKLLDKTKLSIDDMEKALEENSVQLYRIKKDIVIKNLDELGR